MADIFLSYSHYDRPRAEPIVRALSEAGYSVFWDQSTPSGGDWNALIREELQSARVCVVLWSKSSVDSRNVVHEATIALNANRLVPAMLEPLAAEDFPMGFYTVQAVDLSEIDTDAAGELAHLVSAVRTKIGRPRDEVLSLPKVGRGIPQGVTVIRARAKSTERRVSRRNSMGLAMTALAGCVAGYVLIAMPEPTASEQSFRVMLDQFAQHTTPLFN